MKSKLSVRDIAFISLFAALTAVSGYISIPLPISTVPITAQSLCVMLAGSLLTPVQAGLSILVFLLVGAIGLPVFSGGAAGLGIIVGKTGGYLIGFLVGAVFIALVRGKGGSFYRLLLANFLGGIVIVYLFGVFWLDTITGIGLQKAFLFGALPFITGDVLKVILASVLGQRLNKYLRTYR